MVHVACYNRCIELMRIFVVVVFFGLSIGSIVLLVDNFGTTPQINVVAITNDSNFVGSKKMTTNVGSAYLNLSLSIDVLLHIIII